MASEEAESVAAEALEAEEESVVAVSEEVDLRWPGVVPTRRTRYTVPGRVRACRIAHIIPGPGYRDGCKYSPTGASCSACLSEQRYESVCA